MGQNLVRALQRWRAAFGRDRSGSAAVQFAIALLPIAGMVGFAVDYTRASRIKADVQESLDAATLAGARDDSSNWRKTALNVFRANSANVGVVAASPDLSKDADGTVTGSLSVAVPTEVAGIIGFKAIAVGVRSTAFVGSEPDNSCILTLGDAGNLEHDSMVFNGGPRLKFDQCKIRSNTSMRCNGHDGGSVTSIAAGTADACSNPRSNARAVPDIYAGLASNITRMCGAATPGAVWKPGQPPVGIPVLSRPGYIEYHVCGELTLSGSGELTGSAPAVDTVIVVENGGLTIDDKSSISTVRTAIVLTGNGSRSAAVTFPNGNGKASTLALSPPTDPANPWRGISLYQDPDLTDVDSDWGPGATFKPDGVVYMPKADLVLSGNSASNLSGCTKIVARTFRTNGSVDISYKQDTAACARLGLKQWSELISYLSK